MFPWLKWFQTKPKKVTRHVGQLVLQHLADELRSHKKRILELEAELERVRNAHPK